MHKECRKNRKRNDKNFGEQADKARTKIENEKQDPFQFMSE